MSETSFQITTQASLAIRLHPYEGQWGWAVEDEFQHMLAGGSCQGVSEAAETAAAVLTVLEREQVA